MKWIDQAERKFGHLAIPGLLRWVALLNAVVFIAYKLYPPTFELLDLYPPFILRGEVWRLVTYIFIPGITSILPFPDWFNAAMFVFFMRWVGDGLDNAWGAFRTNLFYLLGMIGTTIAAFFFGALISNVTLNLSCFFAFARFYPEVVIYIMYVLPAKVKWVAWASAAWLLFTYIPDGLSAQSALLASTINYLIFFGPEIIQDARFRSAVAKRRERFASAAAATGEAMHRCEVCGRTEAVAPELEFRVARDGNEYCTDHLPKTVAAK